MSIFLSKHETKIKPIAAPKRSLTAPAKKDSVDLAGFYEGNFKGNYRIIGEDTGTRRLYTGRIRATQHGGYLNLKGSTDGKPSSGELILLQSSEKPWLEATLRIGTERLVAALRVFCVGDNYPRITGYFYPVNAAGDAIPNARSSLETWFYDWREN